MPAFRGARLDASLSRKRIPGEPKRGKTRQRRQTKPHETHRSQPKPDETKEAETKEEKPTRGQRNGNPTTPNRNDRLRVRQKVKFSFYRHDFLRRTTSHMFGLGFSSDISIRDAPGNVCLSGHLCKLMSWANYRIGVQKLQVSVNFVLLPRSMFLNSRLV